MFEPTSRYARLPIATHTITERDGTTREARYVRRRFMPPAEEMTTLAEHTVSQDERLDHITARYLGDPEQFWRICDANNTMNPSELTDTPGRIIRVPVPQA